MKLSRLLIAVMAMLQISISAASQPLFSIIPEFPPIVKVPKDGFTTVNYLVRNNTSRTRTLTMVPIPGITQATGPGMCSNPFILGPGQSCTLTLNIFGMDVPAGGIEASVVVCKTRSSTDNSPDTCLCARTSGALDVQLDNGSVDNIGKFLVLSDIHYNSLAPTTCPIQQNSVYPTGNSTIDPCTDPNKGMVDTFLAAALKYVNQGGPPDFVMINGDFMAHGLVGDFPACSGAAAPGCVQTTIMYPLTKIRSYPGMNNIPIYPTLGNNDSYTGDYQISNTNTFYSDMGKLFAPFVLPSGNTTTRTQFQTSFTTNISNYITDIFPSTCAGSVCNKILMYNSIPWSNDTKLRCNGQPFNSAACSSFRNITFNFIASHAQPPNGKLPIIAGTHIPYTTFNNLENVSIAPRLGDLSLFKQTPQLWASHLHFFTSVPTSFGPPTYKNTTLAPAITPRANSIPGFLIVTYSRQSGALKQIKLYNVPNYNKALAGKPFRDLTNPNVFTIQNWCYGNNNVLVPC